MGRFTSARPYVDKQDRTFDQILNAANFGLQLWKLKEGVSGQKADRELTKKELDLRGQDIAVREGQLGVNRQQAQTSAASQRLQQQTFEAENLITPSVKEAMKRSQVPLQLGDYMVERAKGRIRREKIYGPEVAKTLDAMEQVHADLVKNHGADRQRLYHDATMRYDEYFTPFKEALSKGIEKHADDPTWDIPLEEAGGKSKRQIYADTLTQVQNKTFTYHLFPDAGYLERQQLEAIKRQAMLKMASRVPQKTPEQIAEETKIREETKLKVRQPVEEQKNKDKAKTDLENDIMQTIGRIANLKAGVNITSEALQSDRPKAVEGLEKTLSGLFGKYKEMGGDLSRFGAEKPPQSNPGMDQQVMAELPPAAENKGRIARDLATGKRYESDGTKWVEIK